MTNIFATNRQSHFDIVLDAELKDSVSSLFIPSLSEVLHNKIFIISIRKYHLYSDENFLTPLLFCPYHIDQIAGCK